ncbi:unnamed protein product, partial [Scytosiphon promiscuus]
TEELVGDGAIGLAWEQDIADATDRANGRPQDHVDASFRSSFRHGSGGGGGEIRDSSDGAWKDRPAGIGPWPLVDHTREGRASLDEIESVGSTGGKKRRR